MSMISQEFRDALVKKDKLMVRIMLKNSLVVDPTFVEFDQLLILAEKNLPDLYDIHDGEVLSNDPSMWTKDYMDAQMLKVISNFSKERVNLLKKICKQLYSNRAEKIKNERMDQKQKDSVINKEKLGTGLVIGGSVTSIAGIVMSEPFVIAAGVVVIIGGALIILDGQGR